MCFRPRLALARSHHTVTVIDDKAYIFGGQESTGNLCSTDVHAVSLPSDTKPASEYACYPAFPLKEAATGELLVPSPRKDHAACAKGKYLVIHGGSDKDGNPIDEDACLWLWDSETLRWSKIHAATQIGKRLQLTHSHQISVHEKQEFLVLFGGKTSSGPSTETWFYDFDAIAWTQLPSCPAAPSSSALVQDTLYSLSNSSELSGSIHYLNLGANAADRANPDGLKWETFEFPANPLVPGPRCRVGGALVPVSTGYGRSYLLYLLGQTDSFQGKENEQHPFQSDVWSLQLPSHGFTGANIKDVIRDKLPGSMESGVFSWAEVEILPTEQAERTGKVHPGPRGYFGASPSRDKKGVVFWGGLNAKGEREGDGWFLKLQ